MAMRVVKLAKALSVSRHALVTKWVLMVTGATRNLPTSCFHTEPLWTFSLMAIAESTKRAKVSIGRVIDGAMRTACLRVLQQYDTEEGGRKPSPMVRAWQAYE